MTTQRRVSQLPVINRYRYYRFLGLFFTFLAGGLMGIRVLQDGKVSFYGTVFKTFNFVVQTVIFSCDPLLTNDAKISYGIPKLFGFTMSLISLVGIILNDDNFYRNL